MAEYECFFDDGLEGDEIDTIDYEKVDKSLVSASGDFHSLHDFSAAGEDNGGLANQGLLHRARSRSCKADGTGCCQIRFDKEINPIANDTRKGCIAQFSPEEIVALQLSIMEMDKSKFICLFVCSFFVCLLVFMFCHDKGITIFF